ncbi:MAG: sulfate reduction electron transfer complex DsrMKJOP subunit DsrJ [Gemmatimonadetes bacterium]|jgi:hypothetical protein|nr:sulfate reduction electron transfer complex DsrMKJOP subunit DsrJ [Gemmatimonadota bacterium]
MNDRIKIAVGLAIFVVLVTFPIWSAFGSAPPAPPDLAKPVKGSQCVEEAEWMSANHQQLLNQWRDTVIREGKKEYTSTDGAQYEMSLSKTCMSCHENQQTFCDRCHDYTDVHPTCWKCHLDPSREVTEP